MEVYEGVHQIKIEFCVTEEISRYVYMYLIEGEDCYLIDSGVAGSERKLAMYMKEIGRDLSDIKGIFLTHAHPDHIGGAAGIKELTGCRVYASEREALWIEDIDAQFRERPIPNFYKLAGKSVAVDEYLTDGDSLELEPGITLNVMNTEGHSVEDMSYHFVQKGILFTGDSIPVKGDIPIYVNRKQTLHSLERLRAVEGIRYYCPAWDTIYDREEGIAVMDEAVKMINELEQVVLIVRMNNPELTVEQVTERVCDYMGLTTLVHNPLFQRTIEGHMNHQRLIQRF